MVVQRPSPPARFERATRELRPLDRAGVIRSTVAPPTTYQKEKHDECICSGVAG